MNSSQNNSINSLLIFHFNVTVLKILNFLLSRISDNNINNITKLLEIFNNLGPCDRRIKFVDENLIIIIVSTDIEIIVTNFY